MTYSLKRTVGLVAAALALALSMVMMIVPRAYAYLDVSGNVNASELSANGAYRLSADAAINVDADVTIDSFDLGNHTLTLTGGDTYTLTVSKGIEANTNGNLTINSGKLHLAINDDRDYWPAAINLPEGAFTMTGGDLYISFTSSGESVYMACGLDVGSFAMTGGNLSISCLCYFGSARAISCTHDFTLSGGTITAWAGTNEAGGSGKAAAGIGTGSTNDADLLISGGKVTAHAECATGQYAYGISWTNDKTKNTTVISGGTVEGTGVDYGIQSWAPMTISGTANVEAHAKGSYALLVTDNLTFSDNCKVTAITEDTGCSAIAATGSATMGGNLRITTPGSGQWKKVSGYDQVCDHAGNQAQNVIIEEIPANYHKLGICVWDATTQQLVTDADSSTITIAVDGASTGLRRYETYLAEGASFTLDTSGMPEGWVWKGWLKDSPYQDYIHDYIEGGASPISRTLGTADEWYYAVFESPKTIIPSLSFTTSFVPVEGDTAVRPSVTVAEANVNVSYGQWWVYDEYGVLHTLSEDHVFVAGEKVQLRIGYSFGSLYALADDIEDHVTVNGYAPDVFRHDNEKWVGVDYTIEKDNIHVPSHIAITYDASRVFPTTRLTGQDVSLLLLKYTTSNPGRSLDGKGWYVYGCKEDPKPTDATEYTCLVKKVGSDYEPLEHGDSLLSPLEDYYLRFNIENERPRIWDVENLPTATVNDEAADDVTWSDQAENGDIFVYKKVNLDEVTETVLSVTVSPQGASIQRGTSRVFEATVNSATQDGFSWSLSGNESSGTTLDSSGRLTVAADEPSNTITLTATSSARPDVYGSTMVSIIDEVVKIESVSLSADKTEVYSDGVYVNLTATVEGTDYHDVDWELTGATTSYFTNMGGTWAVLYVCDDETSSSLTVKATSKADPTKSDTVTITVKDHPSVVYPINITYDASKVVLSADKTGRIVTREFRQAITSPFGTANTTGSLSWYVYGSLSETQDYTGLVKKVGEGTFENLTRSDDPIDPEGDYYLWFNIEDRTPYEFKSGPVPPVTVNGRAADYVYWDNPLDVYVKIDVVKWERLSGAGRYDTMAAIVEEGFGNSDYAVVATGDNFPDALAASALAGYHGCPVILTKTASLSPQAEEQLKRLNVKNVYIMGGTGAVSQATENAIAALGITVTRIAGSDRRDTSVKAMNAIPRVSDTVIIATGQGYADTLSIGPWSYATCSPIILTKADGTLDESEVAAIKAAGYSMFVLVGGTGVVSDTVKEQLEPDLTCVARLGGANRYETSKLIAEFSLANGLWCVHPAIATGANYPDALAGAALCGSYNSIMVLVQNKDSAGIATLAANKDDILHGYVFGGTGAVSDSLMNYVANATK